MLKKLSYTAVLLFSGILLTNAISLSRPTVDGFLASANIRRYRRGQSFICGRLAADFLAS